MNWKETYTQNFFKRSWYNNKRSEHKRVYACMVAKCSKNSGGLRLTDKGIEFVKDTLQLTTS